MTSGEPEIKIMPVGESGWPPIVQRFELPAAVCLTEAAYWLARSSRVNCCGVVAKCAGRDIYAWPHQTVDQVCREHLRALEVLPPPDAMSTYRWHPARKAAIVEMVHLGLVYRGTILAHLEMDKSEWPEWERAWERWGQTCKGAVA